MKRVGLVLIGFIFWGCNSENAIDCFQNSGDLIREAVSVSNFDRILVFEQVALVVQQGEQIEVEIETGEFLRNDVSATVIDGTLVLENRNNCNLFRDFGLTTVYVTAPNILEIQSSTGLPIRSSGVLNYPELRLISESFSDPELETTDGAFNMELSSQSVTIITNGIAFFQLSGSTQNFNITVAAGDSRIEAANLIAENVSLNHRGSNDIFINPQQSLTGVIRGFGNVIAFNEPPVVTIEELFRGRLIFRN